MSIGGNFHGITGMTRKKRKGVKKLGNCSDVIYGWLFTRKSKKYCNNNKSFSDYRREFSDDDKKPNDHQSAAADSLLEINTNLNKETLTGQPPTSATHFPSSSHLATNRSTIDILKGMYIH